MPSLGHVYQEFGEVSEAARLLETELGSTLLTIEAAESDLFFANRQQEEPELRTRGRSIRRSARRMESLVTFILSQAQLQKKLF